jgi:O-methyltransferase
MPDLSWENSMRTARTRARRALVALAGGSEQSTGPRAGVRPDRGPVTPLDNPRRRPTAEEPRAEEPPAEKPPAEKPRAEKPRAGKRRAGKRSLPPDFDEVSRAVIPLVRGYTMTGPDKLHALISAVQYVAKAGIPGAFVECGVWRGGSMHAVARTLDLCGVRDRDLYLFDTFQGMTEPTTRDRMVGQQDVTAADLMQESSKESRLWAIASKEDVLDGLSTLPYPQDRFHLVEGPVEDTVPDGAPEEIALLRLDTDWYESTRHELVHLYPRLQPGGVLIIDDYGSWQGSKEATDEYLASLPEPLLLMRAARSRIAVKPGR